MKKGLLIICAALALTFVGCTSKKSDNSNNGLTHFEETITSDDSTAVRGLIDQFFSLVIDSNTQLAASMLYKLDKDDLNKEPDLLDNEEMATIRDMFDMLKVKSYRIDYMKFSEYYSNEVCCTAILEDATPETPEVATKVYFRPVSHLGGWVLCLSSSEDGDAAITSFRQRDSLGHEYQQGMKSTEE